MSVYFGHPTSQRNERKIDVSDALKQIGVNLLRAAPSQVVCDVLPYVTSPIWSFFIASLSALMLSVSTNKPVSLNLEGYRIDNKHPSGFVYTIPRLSIEVRNKGTTQTDWLIKNDFEEQEIRGKSYFVCEEPTPNILRQLLDGTAGIDFNDRNYVPLRTANLSSLLILSEMFNTLSYLTQVTTMFLYNELPPRASLTRTVEVDLENALSTAMEEDAEEGEVEQDNKGKVVSGVESILKLFSSLMDFGSGPSNKDTVTAMTLSSNRCCISSKAFTKSYNSYGLFLRYLPDLSSEDDLGVISFFSNFLKRSLGNSQQEIVERLDDYRSAWGILKSTESGHILSHLTKSLRIGFEAHCAIIPIFSKPNYYEGCVLVGNGFSLNFRHGLFLPMDPTELGRHMLALETNELILDKIFSILNSADVIVNNVTNLMKPAALREYLLLGAFDMGTRSQLDGLIRKLRSPYKRWPVTLGSITRFLTLLKGPLTEIDDETPIGPEGMFSTDPIEVLMSCFKMGACPSFRHPSGVAVDLSLRKPPAPPSDLERKKGKGPQQVNNGGWVFSVRRVDYVEAVSDFRTLVKEKEARSLGSAASRGLGHYVISGGNFERVFLELRDVLASIDPTSILEVEMDPEMGSKRKKGESYDDDGKAKLKRRVML